MGQRTDDELQGISHLGKNINNYKTDYDPKLLESFLNKNPGSDQWVSFVCTEFTSLCPKTGQPDFAKIFINYIANEKMVESKSLKLYLFSFRNHGDFHEDCIDKICSDIKDLIQPKYIEVIGEFTPRGGIAIFPFSSWHDNSSGYEELFSSRKTNYAPGKYTFDLGKPY